MAKLIREAYMPATWKKDFVLVNIPFMQDGFLLKELRFPKAWNGRPIRKGVTYRKVRVTIEEIN